MKPMSPFIKPKFVFLLMMFGTLIESSAKPVPTDTPRDENINIVASNGKRYCYAPVFTKGEGYIYIDNCTSSSVKPARYDVFGRIAFNVNNNWLCMTAPDSVTTENTQTWDYMVLRPCVLNDPNQQFKITNNQIWTNDGRFRVKDYKWYAYISKNKDDYYDHTLHGSMQTWSKTIASPVNLSIKSFVSWLWKKDIQWALYFLRNNSSITGEVSDLYYNPENGHIAQYYQDSGTFLCMTSNQTTSQEWNWISWESCNDGAKGGDSQSFQYTLMSDSAGAIIDKNGNFLRLTQYGLHWGVPYTAAPQYLEKDTSNSPTSEFVFSTDIDKWLRYTNGNLGDTLQYCPAIGTKAQANSFEGKIPQRNLLSLPPSFTLTPEWIRRLWIIATTTDLGETTEGICGICLLQSFQMMLELQTRFVQGPYGDTNGYYFDTTMQRDPFVSFRARYPELSRRITDLGRYYFLPLNEGETQATRLRRLFYSTALVMAPDFSWHVSDVANDNEETREALRRLLLAPPGTLWVYGAQFRYGSGGTSGHSQIILRTQDGLVIPPTNTLNYNLERYTAELEPYLDIRDIMDMLTENGQRRITSFFTLEITSRYENPWDYYISARNCEGEGEGRRGDRNLPRSSAINKCLNGRCAIQ